MESSTAINLSENLRRRIHFSVDYNAFIILPALIFLIATTSCYAGKNKTGNDQNSSELNPKIERKVDSLLGMMTLEEKINFLHGNGFFTSGGDERLGIPRLKYTDGPFGIREELHPNSWEPLGLTNDSATFFPTGSALAATWNTDLAREYGIAIGQEARARGKDVLLGPAVNIDRTPVGGRGFEYMTEDPYLNSRMAVSYIKGVQSQDVAACVKHYVANNQETNRGKIDVEMDERTLREIYLPAFKAAVKEAEVYTVMAAYNKFRGDYCSENDYILNKILKDEWGFKGIVISDWGGTHSTVKAAKNGLDVEMGSGPDYDSYYFAKPLLDSVKVGKVSQQIIDDKVRRVLRVMYECGSMDKDRLHGSLATAEHGKTAYDVASESIVLLKNSKNLLPLDIKNIKNVAVIGDNAVRKLATGGFGATVKTKYEITPLQGLEDKLKDKAAIHFIQGYKEKFIGSPMRRRFERKPDNQPDPALIQQAVKAAKAADVAILVVGTNHNIESESFDRPNLTLPFGQDELIKAVCSANPRTIVVMVAASPVDLRKTVKYAPAILWSWYNGSEAGHALADVLFGDINPSGKLPFTIPVKLDDSPAHALKTFPGDSLTVNYSEGILVGYRWFDTKNIQPLFCFGYGLSYTDFTYWSVNTEKKTYIPGEKIRVSFRLQNSGLYPGKETVQLYAHAVNSKVFMPDKELKGFKKVFLKAGEEKEVTIELNTNDLSYYDDKLKEWVIAPGDYTLQVGSSSRDIKGSVTVYVE
jgi:beta-glucosidase